MEPINTNKIMSEMKMALKKSYEDIMMKTIKKEFPNLPKAKAVYIIEKDDFVFTGLTPEQEDYIRKLPK